MPPALKASCIHLVSEKTRTSFRKSTTCPPACGQVNGVRERNEYKVQHMRERHSRCNTHARHSRCNTHARAGLRERNGPNPTRGARATRPATSQRRVGKAAERQHERRTLFCEKLQPKAAHPAPMSLLLLVRSLGVGLSVLWSPQSMPDGRHLQRSTPTCLPNSSRKKNRPRRGQPPTAPIVGGAPPPPMWAPPHRLRRGRIDEMDTSRKPSTRPERRPSLQALR